MKFSRLASALRERYTQEHTFDLYRQLMECERAEIKGVGVYGNLLLDFPADSLIDHRRAMVLVCLVIGLSPPFSGLRPAFWCSLIASRAARRAIPWQQQWTK
jgi:hypothetical protein